ncbi:MAG: alpha/beta hydrolase [Bacteroidia bacterium]|nr:alpha/beta hydrolase [Bacteroidia bacterium]
MKKLILILSLLYTININAQISHFSPSPIALGESIKIDSKELYEIRTLNIYLPDGYSPDSAKTYPVIYLLDGSANEDYIHIAGLTNFLSMYGLLPNSILVGIANVDRKRDFTFPTTIEKDKKDFPTTGSSEKFIAFIEKELQPFIEKNYKTNSTKTIIGQSLGGLLATEILLKKPYLFNNYLIVSPSLWWDQESLLNSASTQLQQNIKSNSIKVYLAVGKEGKIMEGDARKLNAILSDNKNLKIKFGYFPNENHATILHNCAYQGLVKLNEQ